MSDVLRAQTTSAGRKTRGPGMAWLTLVASVLGGVMVGLDGTATTIAAPDLADSVGASLGELELIANAYLVALALALLPAGLLADRIGRRRTFVLGVLGFALSSLAVALSGSVAVLVLFRVVQGLSGALLQPAGLALVRNAFGAGSLGLPLGVWGGANALAIGLGPIVGGILVHGFGWQAVFLINLPVAVVIVVLVACVVAESTGDVSGGPAALRGLLAKRAVYAGAGMVAASMFAVFGLLFLLTLYLQNVREFDPVTAGMWMLPLTGAVVVSAPLGGVLAQRFGSRGPVATGLLAVGGGLAAMSRIGTDAELVAVLWPGALIGLGTGLCLIAATETIMTAAPDESAGSASAVQQVASQLGGVLGIATVTSVLGLSVPGGLANAASHAGPGFVDGMGVALLVAAAVSLAAASAASALPALPALPRQSSRAAVPP